MARWVQISTSEGMSSPKLDGQGCATLQFKAKNVSGAPLDTRAVLRNVPATNPPSGPVQNGWVKIEGSAEQHFEKDQEKVFVVKIAVPKKDKPKPGNYQFRLDVVSIAVPDNGDSSAVMAFTVDENKPEPKPFPMWLIPVIVVVLIGIGVGLWLALRSGPKVPELVGLTVDDATTALQNVDMTLDPKTVPGKPEDVGKILTQSPDKGEKATKGAKVEVTVGARQGPQMVSVVNVVNRSLSEAVGMIEKAGLNVTPSFVGDTNKPVFSQSPTAGASVTAGSSVTLTFPTTGPCGVRRCVLEGAAARQRIAELRLHR